MPKVHESAREWELTLSGRFGEAVSRRRKALRLSAIQLWERTVELGYPVTRIAISKIENNARVGKLDVAEVLILARALEIPPALLLFPDYPDGEVEFLPGIDNNSERALRWFTGETPLPPVETPGEEIRVQPSNPGVDLVGVVNDRALLVHGAIRGGATLESAYKEAAAGFRRDVGHLTQELWSDPYDY